VSGRRWDPTSTQSGATPSSRRKRQRRGRRSAAAGDVGDDGGTAWVLEMAASLVPTSGLDRRQFAAAGCGACPWMVGCTTALHAPPRGDNVRPRSMSRAAAALGIQSRGGGALSVVRQFRPPCRGDVRDDEGDGGGRVLRNWSGVGGCGIGANTRGEADAGGSGKADARAKRKMTYQVFFSISYFLGVEKTHMNSTNIWPHQLQSMQISNKHKCNCSKSLEPK
jgi:hypothetical protein